MKTNKESNNLATSFLSVKGAILGFATGATITGVVNQTRKFQDLQTTLSRVAGSTENGTQVLNFLIDSTRRSTFTVQDLANSFITLSDISSFGLSLDSKSLIFDWDSFSRFI